ncbi:MAG: hypothetical protein V4669_19700 [Pseudomonadota bacterium]
MNASRLMIVAALATAAFGAQADEADASQYGVQFNSTTTRAAVQAQLRNVGPNVWSIQYNPLAAFESQRTRAQVQAEYLANRDTVAAMISEDSGSAYLARRNAPASYTRFAGTPVNAQ